MSSEIKAKIDAASKDVLKISKHMSKKMKKPSSTVDRISELPEEIIHLILLSLDSHKLAARTSILSRRWFRFWSTYPVVDGFERVWFDTFAESTSRRLLHERQVPLLLDSFTIILNRVYSSQYLNQLLSSASLLSPADDDEAYGNRSPLKVVFIHTFTIGKFYQGRMLLNCRRTKFLHLQNCDLTQFCGFKNGSHYNLLELNLQHVRVTEQIFLMFVANAPRLEKLSLRSVHGVCSFDICASGFPCLKSLSFDGEHRYEKMIPDMELQLTSAPLLQTLTFQGKCKSLIVVSSLSALNLKFVEIQPEDDIVRSDLHDLISKFSSLESLHLHFRRYIHFGTDRGFMLYDDRPRISSLTLRKLTITQTVPLYGFEIDAPNLVTLYIKAYELPINLEVVNVASTCQCIVDCKPYYNFTRWFIELRQCLATLATQFHQLVFNVHFRWNRVVVMDMDRAECESSPLKLHHLQLGTDLPLGTDDIKNHASDVRVLDNVLQTFHPKTLSIARLPHSCHNRSLFSYISGQIGSENLRNCCSNNKCWRHKFKHAKIASVVVDDLSAIDKSMISQPSINMIFIFRRFLDLDKCENTFLLNVLYNVMINVYANWGEVEDLISKWPFLEFFDLDITHI